MCEQKNACLECLDKLCVNDFIKEEQILPDKTDIDLNMDFKMADYKNDLEKRWYVGYTNETGWCLNNEKGHIPVNNKQKNDLDNLPMLNL